MKRKLFQILMLVAAVGFLASCKKDVDAPHNKSLHQPAPAANDSVNASLTRLPVAALKLTAIKNYSLPVAQFVYDLKGRLTKVVERNAKTAYQYVTTTYMFGNGTIAIKRFLNDYPSYYLMNLQGALNNDGRITALTGVANDRSVKYAFSYNASGRLTQWMLESKFAEENYTRHYIMKYGWNADGNLASTNLTEDGSFQETKLFTYNVNQVDKRGLWNDVLGIWNSGLFGLHNKLLCTNIETTSTEGVEPTISQSWSLNLLQYPAACTVTDPSVNASPVPYSYTFQ